MRWRAARRRRPCVGRRRASTASALTRSTATMHAGVLVTVELHLTSHAAPVPSSLVKQRYTSDARDRRTPLLRPADATTSRPSPTCGTDGWRDGHLGHVPEALHAAPPARATSGAGTRARLDATTVAATERGVVGFVTVRDDEIEQLYVDRAARGGGRRRRPCCDHGEARHRRPLRRGLAGRRRRQRPGPALLRPPRVARRRPASTTRRRHRRRRRSSSPSHDATRRGELRRHRASSRWPARSPWSPARPAAPGGASPSSSARPAPPSTSPGARPRRQRSEMDRPETIEETADARRRGRRAGDRRPGRPPRARRGGRARRPHRRRAGRPARPRQRHLGRHHDGVGQDGVGVVARRRAAHAAPRPSTRTPSRATSPCRC